MKESNTAIISDFSKTITSSNNPTTWSVFAKSWLLGEDYTQERNEYFELYHDYELQWNIEKTKEWWKKHLELFIKYWLTRSLIDQITQYKSYFEPREYLKDFINSIKKNNIDLYITSSWVSDFIESFFLQNSISREWIQILWNKLIFDETWKVIWYDKNSIITTLTKGNHNFGLESYKKVVLLWDVSTDLKMYDWECTKIWFCNKADVEWFDIYLWEDWKLTDILSVV